MKNTLENLQALLRRRNAEPESFKQIDLEIQKSFHAQKAIYISDMSGFSRIVKKHGIIHFLAMIQRMQDICLPALEENHGALVKGEADNIFAVFDCVEDAVRTARQVQATCAAQNKSLAEESQIHLSIGIGFGKILLIDYHDMYGDELNLASKLGEDIAERGEVLLTDVAYKSMAEGYARAEERKQEISGVALRYYLLL